MADERRTSPRVRVPGLRVVYESGGGQPVEADALDLGTGGLFVGTATPLAVGKRISLEIQGVGEAAPWPALGRVVWSREKGEGESAPPGMGVKLIDADDAVLAALGRLVETGERTEPGVGRGSTPPPVPVPVTPPQRERTLLGVGTSGAEPPMIPQGGIANEGIATKAVSAPPPARVVVPAAKGGGIGRTVVILVLLVVAGIAAYVLLDAFRHHRHSLSESISPSAGAVV